MFHDLFNEMFHINTLHYQCPIKGKILPGVYRKIEYIGSELQMINGSNRIDTTKYIFINLVISGTVFKIK